MVNKYAHTLHIIGIIIIILGVIGSLIAGSATGYYSFNWTVALVGILSSVVSGIIFLGFSEIIELLDSINRKLDTKLSSHEAKVTPSPVVPQKAVSANSGPAQAQKPISQGETVVFDFRPTNEPIVCPKCGTSQRNNRNVCMNCGAQFKFLKDMYNQNG